MNQKKDYNEKVSTDTNRLFQKEKQRLVIIICHNKKWQIIKMFCSVIYFNLFFDFHAVVTLFCFMQSSILFSESDAHAQLDDVELIDQDQQFGDEQDDYGTRRWWGGRVDTICGHKETQERCAAQTI